MQRFCDNCCDGRTTVFIDKGRLVSAPLLPDLAPRRQAPVLQYRFDWKALSGRAGAARWNFYFRLDFATLNWPSLHI